MKNLLFILTLALLYSCQNQEKKLNERLKTEIYKKGVQIQENYSDYKFKIKNSGYANLLNLERLKSDKKQIESNEIIKKAENIFLNFNQKNKKFIIEIKSLFDSIKPTNELSQNDIRKMKSKFEKSLEVPKSNYKIDSTAFNTMKKIINLFEKKCEYEITDNQIRFYNNECVFDYNRYYMNLQSIIMKAQSNALDRQIEETKDKYKN